MKLIGNLKKRVDKATDISEKRSLIEEAGMKLTDDELNMVSGGGEDGRIDFRSVPCPNGCDYWGIPGELCLLCRHAIPRI